ncbi:hypothetical protein BH24ACT14_BH24ACT14_20010 [soil metagenome]
MAIHTLLPAEPRSAGQARRFVGTALHQFGQERYSDTTELLVSELVTNAVLHSRSAVGVRISAGGSVVRVEVSDGSTMLPAPRGFSADAATGRGLELVEVLSSRWGVEPRQDGKTVWFELGEEPTAAPDDRDGPVEPRSGFAGEGRVGVHLLGVPITLYRAMQQHDEALLREHTLLTLGASAATATATGTVAQVVIERLDAGLRAADAAGEESADLVGTVGAEDGAASARLLAVLQEADELARVGQLLTPPTLPEVRGCRRWWLEEVVAQTQGGAPTAWAAFIVDQPDDAPWEPDVSYRHVLDQLSDAIVVGDDRNRITHVNPAAAQLLGWSAADLTGRRLTAIVPPRLRDAHIFGYTRYLVTGTPQLIGRPVKVPALRRDGIEVTVELLLSVFVDDDGNRGFVGSLRELAQRDETAGQRLVDRGLAAVEDVVATLFSPGSPRAVDKLAERAADTLARALGWPFAAVWSIDEDGRRLRCSSLSDGAANYPALAAMTRQQRLSRGAGLPGRVWQSGLPAWIPDVTADANFSRAAAALQSGLRSGLAFPVKASSSGQPVAVVELLSDELIDVPSELLTVLHTIGVLVGAAAHPGSGQPPTGADHPDGTPRSGSGSGAAQGPPADP